MEYGIFHHPIIWDELNNFPSLVSILDSETTEVANIWGSA